MDQQLVNDIERYAHDCHDEELELLRQLTRIPAPTRHEERRADFVASWLHAHGASDVHIDGAKNVICQLGPRDATELVVFSAHTDVVFDDEDELPLEESNGRLLGPGVGDDTANLVGLLMATRYLLERPELLPHKLGVLVVANSCEEGLGNLDGMRAVFDAFAGRIRSFVSFDTYLPNLVDTAVGSHRWRIDVTTQGGHSYYDFGRPNAIAELAALVCKLYAQVPADGTLMAAGAPVTLNVGRIEGGTTVNAIAAQAHALYEYRSTSDEALGVMRTQLEAIVAAHQREGVTIELSCIGIRPGNGAVDAQALAELTQRNAAIIRRVTGEEPHLSPSSTDANIPLSRGIPANNVGAVRGALLHTRDEWIEKASLVDGLRVILEVMLSSWQDEA